MTRRAQERTWERGEWRVRACCCIWLAICNSCSAFTFLFSSSPSSSPPQQRRELVRVAAVLVLALLLFDGGCTHTLLSAVLLMHAAAPSLFFLPSISPFLRRFRFCTRPESVLGKEAAADDEDGSFDC